jgi:hypothetical protein
MNLKTLLEQLKPEVREAIESQRSLYPNTIDYLCRNLSEVYFVSDLRYEDAMNIMSHYKTAFGKKAETPWDCLNRSSIWEAE